MEKKTIRRILLPIFLILLIIFGFVIFKYNQERNEVVQNLILKGYTCNKNIFGFYSTCYENNFFKEKSHEKFMINWSIKNGTK